jgi:membrane protein YdbS with pleckstrin-like domain
MIKIRFSRKLDQSVWRLVRGIVVAVLFFVAFVFSYALPASSPTVPWQFYSIAGIFAITALIFGILVFDKELYGGNNVSQL